jgi:surfeit locus 1 family protein
MTATTDKRLGAGARWAFIVVMLGLTALFVTLGTWQLERLAEKEAQIATVAARVDLAPVPLPPVEQWSAIDTDDYEFLPVTLTGTFDHTATVLVFDNLPDPEGEYGGAGYWVMAPLMLETGGLVWINRGFVPQHLADGFAQGGAAPEGARTIEGVALRPQRANIFTPGPDVALRREWIRDPARLSDFLETDQPTAPITVDLPAGQPGALPQGGETEMTFSNRHLEYAGTWFAFALITPIMLGFWLWRQRKT